MCFSCLFPSLPPHTLAAATTTPNAKSTLQAGWHKHPTILARASFSGGFSLKPCGTSKHPYLAAEDPVYPSHVSNRVPWLPMRPPISLCLNQTKQQHFVLVHWFFTSHPKKIHQGFIISLNQSAMGKYCCCGKRGWESLQNEQEHKRDIVRMSGANTCTKTGFRELSCLE